MTDKMDSNLSFKGENPGAVRYGNFINYYDFHPPNMRIDNMPRNLWSSSNSKNCKNCAILDIGCNSGKLTVELHDFVKENSNWENVSTLGIDIDGVLIERSIEMEKGNDAISFEKLDIMSDEAAERLQTYLRGIGKEKFDIIFCFSVTMWIHLNHGDEGLKRFLKSISDNTHMLVLEPQPWKCYKSAVQRMRKCSEEFPLYPTLKIRNDVESEIENIIINNGNLVKKFESTPSGWNRKTLFFCQT